MMWLSERDMRREQREPAAELGVVTLGGDPAGVSLGGERRQLPVYSPGGVTWRPAAGDRVLVLKTGAAGEQPCVIGRTQQGTDGLAPGAVRLAAPGGGGGVLADREGVNLYGTVKVGGMDVRDYRLESLRDGVSMVLQNGTLFSGTIASNLRWGKPDATVEEMQAACAISCADEYIDRFPDGYETVLEQNAANLSGGQRQRLRIARAILKAPKILILDDSTSAVDMATDEHIRRGLKGALPGTTKIIIAQRIASIVSCDRILVLDEGKLSDFGTHEELMARSQIYRDVYDSQMKQEVSADAES